MTTIDRPLVVLDFETTGLDISADYPIEVGVVVLDKPSRGLTVLDEYRDFICPPWHARWTRRSFNEAQKVHGISWGDMRKGLSYYEAATELDDIRKWTEARTGARPIIAGCNVSFDYWMLKRLHKLAALPSLWDYHTLDLSSVSMATIGVMSLKKVALELEIDITQYKAHSALDDAKLTAECLRRLLPIIETVDQKALAGPKVEPVLV